MKEVLFTLIILLAFVLALVLVWKFPQQRTRASGKPQILFSEYVDLPDGRKIQCVWHGTSGGVSCDWSNAK
jgi:hypothetical protein